MSKWAEASGQRSQRAARPPRKTRKHPRNEAKGLKRFLWGFFCSYFADKPTHFVILWFSLLAT